MGEHSGERDGEWTGCAHCGQALRIAEQAWDRAADAAQDSITARWLRNANPYRPTPPTSGRES